jgi:regulatory protein
MPGKKAAPKDIVAAALRLLSYRPRSMAELKEKLLLKGFEAAEAEKAVTILREAGYLDDERFAALLADSRVRNKNWGPSRIVAELIRKGVPTEIIRSTVAHDPEAEASTALAAFDKWIKKTGSPCPLDRKAYERAYRFLKGRGFSTDAIFKVINGFKGNFEPSEQQR